MRKLYSSILPVFVLFAMLAQDECKSNNDSSSSRSSFNNTVTNDFTTVARIKIGWVSFGVDIDNNGKVKFDYKIAKSFTIGAGPVSLELGIKKAFDSVDAHPDTRQLFIITKDSQGNVKQSLQYDIGEEFEVDFYKPEMVKIIGRKNSVIIVISSPESSSSENKSYREKPENEYFVDTRDNSGLYLRESKDINSGTVTFIPENGKLNLLFCTDEINEVNGREGKWCKVEANNVQGWAFDQYLNKKPEKTVSSTSPNSYRYFVDTRDNSGLYLREDKDLESDSTIFVSENKEINLLYCDDELSYVKEREGRWCRVEYNNTEGWAWSLYLREVTK